MNTNSSEPSDYKIVKHVVWDDEDAKYHIWWTLHIYRKPFLRKLNWYPVKYFTEPVKYYSSKQAQAAAVHYNIKVER